MSGEKPTVGRVRYLRSVNGAPPVDITRELERQEQERAAAAREAEARKRRRKAARAARRSSR